MTFQEQNIWIIGASSGIGKELAIQLHELGANLILSARSEDKLLQLNKELQKKHNVLPLDISSPDDIKEAFDKISNDGTRLDRVIFLPAIYKPDSIENMETGFMSSLVDVNLKGALYFVHALLPVLKKQRFGQIAICGSVAGYTGLPNGQPYSCTKAAIINFTESLYLESPDYIDVKLISPGFVETPMTNKNSFKMPMIVSTETAAQSIIKGLNKKKFEIHFPKGFTFLIKLVSMLPYVIKFKVTNSFR